MKLLSLIVPTLVAAVANALPTEESGTPETAPFGLAMLERGNLVKDDTVNLEFEAFPEGGGACQSGGSTFSVGAVGSKGNFFSDDPALTIRIIKLTQGLHAVFYTGLDQSGNKFEIHQAQVGQCLAEVPGGDVPFFSWGLFNGS